MTYFKFIKGIVKACTITLVGKKKKKKSVCDICPIRRTRCCFNLGSICVVSGLKMQGKREEKDIT